MREMPNASPTILNVPRSPTIVATFSGINSMHALLTAGVKIPEPMPETRIRKERRCTTPHPLPVVADKKKPGARRSVVQETMARPHTMGHRYPHRLSRKLVIADAAMVPKDRGVSIIPLINVESLCTEVA